MRQLWEILVPATIDSVRLPDEHHKWDEFVRSTAGGLTILHTVKGQ
jgi:hypothetical protein